MSQELSATLTRCGVSHSVHVPLHHNLFVLDIVLDADAKVAITIGIPHELTTNTRAPLGNLLYRLKVRGGGRGAGQDFGVRGGGWGGFALAGIAARS